MDHDQKMFLVIVLLGQIDAWKAELRDGAAKYVESHLDELEDKIAKAEAIKKTLI